MTSAGLSAILQEIEKHGAPELVHPKHMKEARQHTLKKVNAYGPLISDLHVELEDGGTKAIPVVNLLSLLQALYEQDGSYYQLLKATCERCHCSHEKPLDLLYYSDEVVCGNPLSNDTTRKLQMVYVSMGQFGAHTLSKEEAWLVVFCMRSSEVASVKGGMSQVTAAILKHILYSPNCCAKDAGVLLKDKHGGYQRVFLRLGFMIQDGLAQKSIWSLKGDAATRYCTFCSNLVASASSLDAELLTCTCWDISKIVFATEAELQGTLQRLQHNAATMSTQDFKIWQQAVGFNYCEKALPWDPVLRGDISPLKSFVHDYMHAFFVKGVFNTTTYLILVSLQAEQKDIYDRLAQWLSCWKLPRRESMSKLFSSKRKEANKTAGTFKCTAGEGLSLCPLLALFLTLVIIPAGLCVLECTAYLAMADLLDLLVAIPHEIVTPDMLQAAACKFLKSCIDANWADHMHSKHHWLIHFAGHLQKFYDCGLGNMLPNCFVNERKHKLARRYGGDISNTRSFERSVCEELLCHDIATLAKPNIFTGGVKLDKNSQASKKATSLLHQCMGRAAKECFTCVKAHLEPAGTCQRGDIVIIQLQTDLVPAQVYLHASFDGHIISMVSVWEMVSIEHKDGYAICKEQENTMIISTAHILCAVPACALSNGQHRLLLPLQLRC